MFPVSVLENPLFFEQLKMVIFLSWPGLTESLVKKHLEDTIATAKGHLRQEKANLQSTKTLQQPDSDENQDFFSNIFH